MKHLFHFIFLSIGLLGLTEAQEIETEILASSGGIVGGNPTLRYLSFGRPNLNDSGEITIRADLLDDGIEKEALVRISNGQSQIIALSGEVLPAWQDETGPIVNGRPETFGDPVINADGSIACLLELMEWGTTITEGNRQVIAATDGQNNELWILDRAGRPAKTEGEPGGVQSLGEARHLRIGAPFFDEQGGLLYSSVVEIPGADSSAYQKLIYRIPMPVNPSENLSLPGFVHRAEGYSLQGVDTEGDIPGSITAEYLGEGEFRAVVQTDEGRKLMVSENGQQSYPLSEGDPLPGSPGYQISNIQGYSSNPGDLPPFLVEATNGELERKAIVLISNSIRTIIVTGRGLAGYQRTGAFVDLREPVSSESGGFSFVATTRFSDGSLRDSIWRRLGDGVDPRPLAIEGEQVPGAATGVTYRSFGTPFINQAGQVVFPARLNHGFGVNSRNDFALFLAEPNREVRRIVGKGDFFFFGLLDVLPITGFSLSDLNEIGEFAVTLHAENGKSALVKFRISPSSVPFYEDWAAANIPSASERNRYEDPDGDGIPNHLEYAYGSDPLDSSSASRPTVRLLDAEGGKILAMEYSRLTQESDIRYHVEFSNDLKNWNSAGETETLLTETGDYSREQLRTSQSEPSSFGRSFVRIRVVEK